MPTRAHTPRSKPKKKAAPQSTPSPRSLWLWGAGLLGIALIVIGGLFAHAAWWPSVRARQRPYYLHVPTGTDFTTLKAILDTAGIIGDAKGFDTMAEQMGLAERIKPGRYRLTDAISNRQLVNMLRLGLQTPLQLRVPVRRTVEGMAEALGAQLECGADSMKHVFATAALRDSLGVSEREFIGLFIPNSYEVYWNTPPIALAKRLKKEHQKFWDSTRVARAAAQQLTPEQVSALASIVESETYRDDERARIAGVYLNRLRRGMLLQADPTVIFAHQDWSIRRVLNKHLTIDSPYNTYRYAGLPPGPICSPSLASLEAVLAPEQHNYLYFSARAALDGYHNFSETYSQHLAFAASYHAEMNAQARRRRQEAAKGAASAPTR